MKTRAKISAMLFVALVTASPAMGKVIFVDADATGANDGSSWMNAFNYLQDALATAQYGDEIRAAQGIYKPDQGTGIVSGNRKDTFKLINGVAIKGSFAGVGEPDPDARDIEAYETILSGDIGIAGDISDNSYHVVTGSGTDANTVLDGFTIKGGNASSSFTNTPLSDSQKYESEGNPITATPPPLYHTNGGGMYNKECSPTVTNCTFSKNSAYSFGGGIYNQSNSKPRITNCVFNRNSAWFGGGLYGGNGLTANCTFSSNSAEWGGGMGNSECRPMLIKCTFTDNSAHYGGGIYNQISDSVITNCTFSGNSAKYDGGGIYNRLANPTLTNCMFDNNEAEEGGGIYIKSSNPTLANCVFSGNSASNNGGGMYNSSSVLSLINCTFQANVAKDSGGGIHNQTSDLTFTNCTFRGNTASFGAGGMGIEDSNAILTDCAFSGNKAICIVGGLASIYSNVTLTNCLFIENSVPWPAGMGCGGAGGIAIGGGKAIVTDCIFSGNSSRWGGGMVSDPDSLILSNCIFSGNFAYSNGGGIYNISQGIPTILTNCTFSGNSAVYGGGGIYHEYASSVKLANCILWNNTALNGPQVEMVNKSVMEIYYSCIEGGEDEIYDPYDGLVWGPGNIDADPCYFDSGYWGNREDPNIVVEPNDPNALWIYGDYHLRPGSPCIDAGDPNYIAEPNATDLDGRPRVMGGRIDMGAYEYSTPIPAEARIIPRTINLASKGNWITCYIWLTKDYNVADIDPNSVLLENEVEPERFQLSEDKQAAIARFSREKVDAILNIGKVELIITGQFIDETLFEARDVIRVIEKGRNKN